MVNVTSIIGKSSLRRSEAALSIACGEIYRRLRESLETAKLDSFGAGFMAGQAEKIYLGACKAAMFRIQPENRRDVARVISIIADAYSLRCLEVNGEFWFFRNSITEAQIKDVYYTFDENTAEWHLRRGYLVGIPANEIDLGYHKSTGFGEPCDGEFKFKFEGLE